MKKFMLALLVGIMVVGASASMAAAEITVGGELETRYDLWYNLNMNGGRPIFVDGQFVGTDSHIKTQNFFGERILLNVDAKITEGLEAFVELDTNTFDRTDERIWGFQSVQSGFSSSFISPVNHQGETLAIRQAWINFMIPGIPVGMKIGHQPLALGHGIFLDSHRMGQDAILVYSKPIPELLLAGVYVKALELSSAIPTDLTGGEHKDVDIYAALANFTFMPNNTVGVFYLFAHDAADVAGAVAFGSGDTARLHDVGVIADGVIGPVTYKAEVDYQNMNVDNPFTGDTIGVNNSWAFMLGGSANVMNMATVGAEVAYGTGSNPNKDNGFSAVNPITGAGIGNRAYNNPYGTTSYNYAFLYNDKIGQGVNGSGGGLGLSDGTGGNGLANTGYIKLSASAKPMDKLTVGADVLYLRASEPTIPAVAEHRQSRSLGWEVDAHADYKIYDNLALNLTGGVFLPGQFYDDLRVVNGLSPEASTAYGLETKLTCKF